MFYPRYPNLELLEYKVSQLLMKTRPENFGQTRKNRAVEFNVIMFPQVWGSTCIGFDELPDGSAAIGGSAMTKEYTSVFHELCTNIYIVCFGDRPAYMVEEPFSPAFLEDLNKRNMASLHNAKIRY